ncbi:hydroxyisourate hydrolase [Thalassotalea fusca]
MSQITTHILDTTRGLPAQAVPISLYAKQGDSWEKLAEGKTNDDGRIPDLLMAEQTLPAGTYRMHFETQAYFEANNEQGFYPYVDIVFDIDSSGSHYHIPLLLTAFGYSTYRGS